MSPMMELIDIARLEEARVARGVWVIPEARRMGIHVAYIRAILIRPGEGLVGVLE